MEGDMAGEVQASTAIRAVTLDVSGTMIHSPRMGEIYSEVLGRHGAAAEASQMTPVIRRVWQELDCSKRLGEDRFLSHPDGSRGWWSHFVDRVCEHLEIFPPSRFAKAELFDRFGRSEAWEIFPEVPEVLTELRRQGIRVAALSNWDDRLPGLLEDLDLASALDAIVFSAAVGVEKPHPSIFLHALELLGTPPSLTLHVGDRQKEDVEGARGVGIQALLLDRGRGRGDLVDLSGLLEHCVRMAPLI